MKDDSAARAALRKPFPRPVPDTVTLETDALALWLRECMYQCLIASRWNLDGLRWRRAHRRARREFTVRILGDAGASRLCENCHTNAATSHVAYSPHDAPRFAHYCNTCSQSMPVGWMVIVSQDQ